MPDTAYLIRWDSQYPFDVDFVVIGLGGGGGPGAMAAEPVFPMMMFNVLCPRDFHKF